MSPKAKAPATRRQNRGKGHSYFLEGEKAAGVTTIIGDGMPKPALINWASNVTAAYAVDHWEELADLSPSQRLNKLERARWDTVGEASVKGTTVHDLAHRLGQDEEVEVPEELKGYVAATLQFFDDFEVEVLLSEVIVVARRPWGNYMGTFDVLARLSDGLVWLLDYKTGGKGIFPETAIQLAAYADADAYLGPDNEEIPLPAIDRRGAVWLRADGYDLIPCDVHQPEDLDPLRAFAYAFQVARFVNAERGTYIGDTIRPPRKA